jgi:hypothetical protein
MVRPPNGRRERKNPQGKEYQDKCSKNEGGDVYLREVGESGL